MAARVVTWQDTRGMTVDVCRKCEARYKAEDKWVRNSYGEEYAQVSHGEHDGACDMCHAGALRCGRCGAPTQWANDGAGDHDVLCNRCLSVEQARVLTQGETA